MAWWEFYKLWTYQFEKGPLEKLDTNDQIGAGITIPDGVPDIRGDGWKGQIRLHDSSDFIDLSTITNRQSRYKEYERLRNVAEIEMAMTVVADEACIAGDTKIATLFDGFKTIKSLKERWDKDPSPFLVYCWDFEKEDYALGWAYEPRVVKTEKTFKVLLSDGTSFVVTGDHRILTKSQKWIEAKDLKIGDELMPFFRKEYNRDLNKLSTKQFPRIKSKEGWTTERKFIDKWKNKNQQTEREKTIQKAINLLTENVSIKKTSEIIKHPWKSIENWLKKEGFTLKELKWLGKKFKNKTVVDILPYKEMSVYDLSVERYENFCTDTVVMHNCQKNDEGNVFKIQVKNPEVKKELEFLCFNRNLLNLNKKMWAIVKRLCIFGDGFYELITNPNNPKDGVLKIAELPPDSMYKIITTKGRIVEYQQSKEGPDYQSLTRSEVTKATDIELQQSTAIRFFPKQIIHMALGDDRKTFYPYGQSLIEPARGPAHQLRLMEDSMLVYRLTRAPERRIFYIDVGTLPPFKAEAFVDRLKDQFRKKKTSNNRGNLGANSVEERWHAPAADEDYWMPIRPNSNTRIETLPGAQNLGEIDDALYFRNKLFTALNFPKNYFNNEDPGATRITLSAQDARFARMVERIQSVVEDGILDMCERHLEMRGFPLEAYDDLKIIMNPPSAWKELSEAEVMNNRMNMITTLKGSLIMSDYDLLTKFMKLPESEVEKIIARNKIQKLEDLKIQVIGQNPQLLGIGTPSSDDPNKEIGTESGGPNPMISPDENADQAQEEQPEEQETPDQNNQEIQQPTEELPDYSDEDAKKYDLEIQSYDQSMDREEIDWSEES